MQNLNKCNGRLCSPGRKYAAYCGLSLYQIYQGAHALSQHCLCTPVYTMA